MKQPTSRMRIADEPHGEYVDEAPHLLPAEAIIPDPVVEAPVVARPWLDMSEAPNDGSLIEVKAVPDGISTYTTYWRITRRRSAEERAWKVIGFWADPANPTEPLRFEPAAWRYPDYRTAP